jgi:hypothetical protein
METSEKDTAIKFFEEALVKWNDFIGLINQVHEKTATENTIGQANKILGWLQDNYDHCSHFSDFKMFSVNDKGERVEVDPLFDILFRGCTFINIVRNYDEYLAELQQVHPQLRGHLASVKREKR